MHKFVVRDTGNYVGQYWGNSPGEVVRNKSSARKFTVEELVKHRSLAAAIRNKTAAIVEVTYEQM